MSAKQFIRLERSGAVATLILQNPEDLNRLAAPVQFLELAAAISEANLDPSVRALVLTGEGKAFCAGGDLNKMARREGFSEGTPLEIWDRYLATVQKVAATLELSDVPTIAAVNGAAYGAGCDFASFCDMRIAASCATFCVSFAQLGIVSGDGGSWMLPRIVGRSKAMELTFTAEPIDAAEALGIGLVSKVVAPEDLRGAADELAQKIARHPRQAVRMGKKLLRASDSMSLERHFDLAAAFQGMLHVSSEHLAAVQARLNALKK